MKRLLFSILFLCFTFPALAAVHGQRNTVINLADLGVSTFSTTGSMSAASPTLTVASGSGFAINDHVIVEVGGEAGGGLRGSVGVGGAWPDLSYPNITAMNADTGKPDGQYAYLVDTGFAYQSFSGVWSQVTGAGTYYTSIVIPRALAAKIINKTGCCTFTLDTNSVVATTNANVYFDNAPIFNALGAFGSGVPDHRVIVWPAGTFWLSSAAFVDEHNYWLILGAGKTQTTLAFPNGISDLGVIWLQITTGSQVRDLAVSGNTRLNGYMIAWLNGDQTQAKYNFGIFVHEAADFASYDTKSIDTFQGMTLSFCARSNVYRHDSVLTVGSFVETWNIQAADCDGAAFYDCTFTSPTWTGGLELFRSSNSSINGFTGLNSFIAMNTDTSLTVSNINVTINGADWSSLGFLSPASAFIMDVNSNIGGGGTDATHLNNINLTQNGLARAGTNNDTLLGIAININNTNTTVDGAVITLPDYTAPSTNHGAVGLVADADFTTVKNYTAHGTTDNPTNWANLMFRGASSCYQNVHVDTVLGGAPC